MKHLKKFILFENIENVSKIYGVFIHRYDGSIAIGLFHKSPAMGLAKMLEDRFGFDGDDMTGAFGPLDISKEYTILGDSTGEWEIRTDEIQSMNTFDYNFSTQHLLGSLGSFYVVPENAFFAPDELFEKWYEDDEGLNPVDLSWQ